MPGEVSEVGALPAGAAYALLQAEGDVTLVDVRTAAEWDYVGVPDLSALGKGVIFQEWQIYPGMQVTSGFAGALSARLFGQGAPKTAALLFLCRSGVRSLAAAAAMAQLGYERTINITGGFEGPLDSSRRRGGTDGWKAAGLPWVQK